jgi:hypothetical protein
LTFLEEKKYPLNWAINAQKGGTIFFCLILFYLNKINTPYQWVYAGLHGGYGIIWLLKVSLPSILFLGKLTRK